ncbi:MAG: FAD:protein FMN transferase [Deltaproteobacteria bacterium]
MSRIEFRAMGTAIAATIDADADASPPRLARLPRWFGAWERRLSRFRDDSDLARLNRAQGTHVRVGATLAEALAAALAAAHWTNGTVTPTLLDALERAGYDRNFDDIADRPPDLASPPDQGSHDHRDVSVDQSTRTVRRPVGLRLDLGGTAKGWSADRAAALLGRYAPALVDAGGDVAVSGARRDGGPWMVSVPSPLKADEEIALLAIDRGGVATSGRDRRRWRIHGSWKHHLIDPQTRAPAETDVLSATVVASSACEAEVAAKMVLLLGSLEGLAWLDMQPGLAGLVVDDANRATATQTLRPYLVS